MPTHNGLQRISALISLHKLPKTEFYINNYTQMFIQSFIIPSLQYDQKKKFEIYRVFILSNKLPLQLLATIPCYVLIGRPNGIR